MADGLNQSKIMGIGTVRLRILTQLFIELENVLFVPDLITSLFYITTHMNYKGCYFHAENNKTTLEFPTTACKIQGDHVFLVNSLPVTCKPQFFKNKCIIYQVYS